MHNKKELTSKEKTIIFCVAGGILVVLAVKHHNKKIFKKGYEAGIDNLLDQIFNNGSFTIKNQYGIMKHFVCNCY